MNNYMLDLKDKLSKIDKVRSCIYLNVNGIKFNYSYNIINPTFILGIDEYKKYNEVILKLKENDILDKYEEFVNEENYKYVKCTILDGIKIVDYIILQNSDIKKYLRKIRNYEILFDKEDILYDYSKKEDDNIIKIVFNSKKMEEEFLSFYITLVKIAAAYIENNYIKINILKSELNNKIIKLFNAYVLMKYENKIMVDNYGKNLSKYLDKEYLEDFIDLYNYYDNEYTWTYIFKSAQIYRKVGLKLSENKDYDYPKEKDVNILEYLRSLYNKK